MSVSKTIYLLRKYDLLIQEYAQAPPKWAELTFVEYFWGKQFKGSIPQGGPLTVRFWGGEGLRGRATFLAAFKHYTMCFRKYGAAAKYYGNRRSRLYHASNYGGTYLVQ